MDALKLLTAIYDLGLGCGIFDVSETIEFCDLIIEKIDKPPIEIIEASMMKGSKIDDIKSKLAEFHKTSDIEYVVKIILGIIGEKYKCNVVNIRDAASCIARLLVHTGLYCEREYYELYYFDDAYDLAENHVHHDLNDVIDSFKECISKYDIFYSHYFDAISNMAKER